MDPIFHWALQTRRTDQETFINKQRFRTITCKAFDVNHI